MLKKISFVVFILLLSGCTSIYNPATQRKEYYFISERSEIDIGQSIAKKFIQENKMLENSQKLVYVRAVGQKIAAISYRNNLRYEFFIIDDDKINAFALPGGYIFLHRGLLENFNNKDELAFVLSHEIGHVDARHSLKRLQANMGFTLLTLPLRLNSEQASAKALTDSLFTVVSSGYSRKDEFQADSLALQYMEEGGFDPGAAISVFEMFKRHTTGTSAPYYLRTHPHHDERIENVKSKLRAQ